MTRILVTKPLLEEGLRVLADLGDLTVMDGPGRTELLKGVRECDAIVATLREKFDAEIFAAAKSGPLKIVANYAVGYDNFDVAAAHAAGIHVTNTPDALTNATAEMAWTLLFAAARRLPEGEPMVREGRWTGWTPTQLIGTEITGKTIGVIGAGRIGQAFARMGKGFGIRILYHNRHRAPEFEKEAGARYVTLDELLRESDIVSVHVPGGEETRHLLSREKLALMKPSAILINTGRGTAIEEAALCEALREKRIRAAGLDVYEKEPVVFEELRSLPNVVLAPHLGSATYESRLGMAERCAANIRAALKGETPRDAL